MNGRFCQLRAMRKTAAPESNRQTPATQPAAQPMDRPDFGAALIAGAEVTARDMGASDPGAGIVSALRHAGSFSSRARFQAAANSAAVEKRSLGSLASALRITCSMEAGMSDLIEEGRGNGSLTCLKMIASGVSAIKGTRPVTIS